MKWWHIALAVGGYVLYKKVSAPKTTLTTTEDAQKKLATDMLAVAKKLETRLAQSGASVGAIGVTQTSSGIELYRVANGAIMMRGTSIADLEAQIAKI